MQKRSGWSGNDVTTAFTSHTHPKETIRNKIELCLYWNQPIYISYSKVSAILHLCLHNTQSCFYLSFSEQVRTFLQAMESIFCSRKPFHPKSPKQKYTQKSFRSHVTHIWRQYTRFRNSSLFNTNRQKFSGIINFIHWTPYASFLFQQFSVVI